MRLEERLDSLKRRVQAAKDRGEVANVFATYQYYHSLIYDGKTVEEIYAQHQPDVRHDWGGVLEGLDELRRYYVDRPRYNGKLICHFLANPVIQIAGDGKTAKGYWIAAGHECTPYPERPKITGPDGDPVGPRLEGPDKYGIYKFCHWVWNKYGVDFIREDGKWRVWHLRTSGMIRTHFSMDWIDFSLQNHIDDRLCALAMPLEGVPSKPLNAPPTYPSPNPPQDIPLRNPWRPNRGCLSRMNRLTKRFPIESSLPGRFRACSPPRQRGGFFALLGWDAPEIVWTERKTEVL